MAIDVIGLAGTLATLISLLTDNSPASERGNSMFRTTVGLDGTPGSNGGELSNAGGDAPAIIAINRNGDEVGRTGPAELILDHIDDADSLNAEIGQGPDHSGDQAVAAYFLAGNDAICVVSIIVTWPNQLRRGWIGDNGVPCGQFVFPSGVIINDENYEPYCTWLDNDHSNDIPSSGVYIDFREFAVPDGQSLPEEESTTFCGEPAQVFADNAQKRRRSAGAGPPLAGRAVNDTRLVVSGSTQHMAADVCAGENTFGPDYISLADGMYCDMSTREVMPLCTDDLVDDCFDLDDMDPEVSRSKVKKRGLRSTGEYSRVMDWRQLRRGG
ncbi:hypothetical protein BDY21DRAFT_162032 [Lineolata rhizophorae]|uniref:Uncharacterized protein n=1 Tax=Lineolata rhizophorae TaxID=578093 RepID=A0A6A6P8X4_9PEZI|nr:hypothetical protein BDY21DRAFT_162032 [Lineolata rhizophorae]